MFTRVNVVEQDQVAEQHTPIRTEPLDQMLPIEFLYAAQQNMRNIGAIESFALHDVRFHPENFFRCAKFHCQTEKVSIMRSIEPGIVDFTKSIPGTKNQINAIATTFGFGQPMWKYFFRLIAGASKCIESCTNMGGPEVQIEVFRLTRNTGIEPERVRPSD